eukprot:300859-Prymnesium_polylepis.1
MAPSGVGGVEPITSVATDRQAKLNLHFPHTRNRKHPLAIDRRHGLRHAQVVHVIPVHAHGICALFPSAPQRLVALHHPQIARATVLRLWTTKRINAALSPPEARARALTQPVTAQWQCPIYVQVEIRLPQTTPIH